MSVYEIDPLHDPRWLELLEGHSRASVFHSRAWLEALQRTYGYQPIAYTTARPGMPLNNGWVFCRINSWLTGERLVSLPFSDHCDPLVDRREDSLEISNVLRAEQRNNHWRYVECRPASAFAAAAEFRRSAEFFLHRIDLKPCLSELYARLHKSSVQRKIKRAEREALEYEEGTSAELLQKFYRLHTVTRRRHGIPSQPELWFSNLLNRFGSAAKICVASKDKKPVAGIFTLRFKNALVYKYGAADQEFFALGGMQMVLWRAIEYAKRDGLQEFDLGRSDLDARGLIVMKERLGAAGSTLSYFRYPLQASLATHSGGFRAIRKRALQFVPAGVINGCGRLLYRHFG